MPTPNAALATVASRLGKVDPRDKQAVHDFFDRQLPKLDQDTQSIVVEWLAAIDSDPTPEELEWLEEKLQSVRRKGPPRPK